MEGWFLKFNSNLNAVKLNAESSLQESVMASSLDEVLFYSTAEKALGPTNEFLNSINEDIKRKEQENQEILNSTMSYIEDEKASNLLLRKELETMQSDFANFSLRVNEEADKVKTFLDEINQYTSDNYREVYSEMDEYRKNYEDAMSSITNLVDGITSRMDITCGRLRSNDHGLRGEIVGGAVNMCDDVEGYTSSLKNPILAPGLGTGYGSPTSHDFWIRLKKGEITDGSMSRLEYDSWKIEGEVTASLNKSIEELTAREAELVRLEGKIKSRISPVVLPNRESLNAVTDVIENTKSEYSLNSGLNHTEQQRIVNEAIKEIENSMNKTLKEVIVPTLENFTKKNIEELVLEYEKSGNVPLKLLTWGRNLLVGLTVLSVAHRMLDEFEELKPLTKITAKIPFVAPKYKARDKAGRGPAEVQAARELNIKHPGLKCRLGRTLLSRVLLNIRKPDFVTALSVYLAYLRACIGLQKKSMREKVILVNMLPRSIML